MRAFPISLLQFLDIFTPPNHIFSFETETQPQQRMECRFDNAFAPSPILETHTISKFVVTNPRTLPSVALPPPKLHFSTWWRGIARRVFHAAEQRRVDANRLLLSKKTNADV